MLDEAGIVVSFYGRKDRHSTIAEHIVDRDVSQFYALDAGEQPLRELHAAMVHGKSARQGWHRHSDGSLFWGTTLIEAVKRRDGRLQGFSHLTLESEVSVGRRTIERG